MKREQIRSGEGRGGGTVATGQPSRPKAKKVEARSEIFSFGAVLYEMVTGARAFQGSCRR